MTLVKLIRQSSVGKCKGFTKKWSFKDFPQYFLWIFPKGEILLE